MSKPVEMEARQRFANLVKNLRSSRNIRGFAHLVGVSHPTVLAWEKCEVAPKRENLERVAELRGESLDQLLSYLEGSDEISPETRLLTVINGASKEQLVFFLRAIAERLESI
jgi:transcriptional regulator with XRE-family HTH domain